MTTTITATREITTTESDRRYIAAAQAKGRMLLRSGAVELVGGDLYAAVKDGRATFYADSEGCDCSTPQARGGHACCHMWAGHYALDTESAATAQMAETAA